MNRGKPRGTDPIYETTRGFLQNLKSCKGDALSCGLARLHGYIGGKPIQVTVSHGPGIEPCRHLGSDINN